MCHRILGREQKKIWRNDDSKFSKIAGNYKARILKAQYYQNQDKHIHTCMQRARKNYIEESSDKDKILEIEKKDIIT